MPGAGVHIIVDRVGGSEVTEAAKHDGGHRASSWGARVTVTRAPFCSLGWGARGRRASAARSAPSRRRRA
jgi:hypothetical protein